MEQDYVCRQEGFSEDETYPVRAYGPSHAAALYARWADQQAGEGVSESMVVLVRDGCGEWEGHVVKTIRQVQYTTEAGKYPAVSLPI